METVVKNHIIKILEHVRQEGLGFHTDRQHGVEIFSIPAASGDLGFLIEK
jgi:hypothetical protein